jgi:hypothetical protein
MSQQRDCREKASWAEPMRLVCLGAVSALFVAAPLIANETVAEAGTGVVLVILHLLLAVAWLVVKLRWGKGEFRCDLVSLAVVGLAVWHGISAVVMATYGAPRPAVNMFWQWVAYATAFLLVRDLVRTKEECRALCVSMIALAAGLSAQAYQQYYVEMPRDRAAYRANPEGVLLEHHLYSPPGSVARELFEQRLDSSEPTATFALTNSLAGFIAPWFVLTLAAAVVTHRHGAGNPRFFLGAAGVVVYLVGCLLLTKSRTAWLASGLGVVLVVATHVADRWRLRWKIPLLTCGVLGLLTAVAVAAGVLDLEVVSEAPKSVLCRFQYWNAASRMIADYPLFGCGPGNFQAYYTAYMLPEASEQVADPHNFLFEIWATAGTPALLLLTTVLGIFLWRTWRQTGAAGIPESGEPNASEGLSPFKKGSESKSKIKTKGKSKKPRDANATLETRACWRIYAGGAVGILMAYPIGLIAGAMPAPAVLWPGLPVGAITVWCLHPWVVGGYLDARSLTIAAAVALVNLLAAGGINFPGVAGSLWLMMALALTLSTPSRLSLRGPRWVTVGALVLVLLLLAACYQTAYLPVVTGRALLEQGEELVYMSSGLEDSAEKREARALALEFFERAAQSDKYASDARLNAAQLYHDLHLRGPDEAARAAAAREFDRMAAEAVQLDRHSQAMAVDIGYMQYEAYDATQDVRYLDRAQESFERGVRLFPSQNFAHARLAWMYHLQGEAATAATEAGEALRLDALTPHDERKLSKRGLFDDLAAPSQLDRLQSLPPHTTAEQLMLRLRNQSGETPLDGNSPAPTGL